MHAIWPLSRKGWKAALLAVLSFGFLLQTSIAEGPGASSGTAAPAAPGETPKVSKFKDPQDGWFDVSQFVDEVYGFVPMVVPITEPAVGYGAAAALVFIDKQKGAEGAGFHRPNISAVGGIATENGTRGVMVFDLRYWLDDQLQTMGGIIYAPVNLDFYGFGDPALQEHPLRYSLTPFGGLARAKYRLGKQSQWWAGLGYMYSATEVKFNHPESLPPGILPDHRISRIGGITPTVSFDSRDNFFTPASGLMVDASCDFFNEALGSDENFQKATLVVIDYMPLNPQLTLGLRGDFNEIYGNAPFYMRPFVYMRGVAAMRYQGTRVTQAEGELRWQCWDRFSLVGFGGVGTAANDDVLNHERNQTVHTYGVGLRYEIARKYGLHMGVDVAWGPDSPVFYIQFGSAWIRP